MKETGNFTLNIAVVDDEEESLDLLKGYIDSYFSETDPTREYKVDRYTSGVNFLSSPFHAYDIVFMDIRMPTMNGLDTAREFREENPNACLIFVTAMAEMAIHGYEVSAMDFLLKPLGYAEFSRSLKKSVARVSYNLQEHITIVRSRRFVKLSVRDLLFVESRKHKLIYHTVAGDIESWGSMSEAEGQLAPYNSFARCNSCYLVNLRYVDEITVNEVFLSSYRLTISRTRKANFMAEFKRYLGAER